MFLEFLFLHTFYHFLVHVEKKKKILTLKQFEHKIPLRKQANILHRLSPKFGCSWASIGIQSSLQIETTVSN